MSAPADIARAPATPFRDRTARILAVVCVASFVVGALASIFPSRKAGPVTCDPSAYSRSAVGHAALVRLLERCGIPVVISARRTEQRLAGGAVLVIAEPSRASEERVGALVLAAPATLLVLQKRDAFPMAGERGWAEGVQDEWAAAEAAIRAVELDADVVRPAEDPAPGAWHAAEGFPVPVIGRPQLLKPRHPRVLRALVEAPEGILLGEMTGPGGRPLLILADPDPIETHGLGEEANALLAVRAVERLRALEGGSPAVVLDESCHPDVAAQVPPPSLYQELLTPPLVCASAQALAVAALLLWAAMRRFGAPLPLPRALEPGTGALVAHTAELLALGGHSGYALESYWREARQRAARALGAPPGLDEDGEVAHLARVLHARGSRVDVEGIAARVERAAIGEGASRAQAALALAREVDRFRREALRGSRDGS